MLDKSKKGIMLDLSSKQLERNEGKMTSRTYETIQGLLSYAVVFSGAIALAFTLEYNRLISENDITASGMQQLPIIFNTAWAIFGIVIVAKAWGFWIENKFWLKVKLADKLRNTADQLDPRRKVVRELLRR